MTDVVAIEETSATGKSTVGRLLARALSWRFLDSGLLYRAAAYAFTSREFASLDDFADVLPSMRIEVLDRGALVEGVIATTALSDRTMGSSVAVVAAHPGVRLTLTHWLRERVAQWNAAVVVGRDIGTIVFPDALLKVFLSADLRVRAERRATELGGSDPRAVAEALLCRDRWDCDRAVAPLVPAADAVRLDTSAVGPSQVAELLFGTLRERCGIAALEERADPASCARPAPQGMAASSLHAEGRASRARCAGLLDQSVIAAATCPSTAVETAPAPPKMKA